MDEFEKIVQDLATKVAPLLQDQKFDEALAMIQKVRNYAIIILGIVREKAEGVVPQAEIDAMIKTVQELDKGVVEIEKLIEKVRHMGEREQ